MIKVNVNNKRYTIPERFTLDQWQRMIVWDFDAWNHWRRIVAVACDIPSEDLRFAEEDSLQLFMGFIVGTMNRRTETTLTDFNTLTFGEFVDLDCYIALGMEKNMASMLDTLKCKTQMADEALWVIDQYVMWRTTIYRQYKTLFGLNDKDFEKYEEDHEEEARDPMSIPRGWYKVIVELANDNILNIDRITEEPLKKVLNFMALQKDKQAAEAEAIRKTKQHTR